jgi:hypothetical protein
MKTIKITTKVPQSVINILVFHRKEERFAISIYHDTFYADVPEDTFDLFTNSRPPYNILEFNPKNLRLTPAEKVDYEFHSTTVIPTRHALNRNYKYSRNHHDFIQRLQLMNFNLTSEELNVHSVIVSYE